MGKRLDSSWRGTAVQHMAHLSRVSPGSDRPTIVPWGAQKTRPTAAPNERPPGRQTSTFIITTIRTAVTEPPMPPEFRTSATRESDKQDQNVREPHPLLRNDKPATPNANDTDLWQITQTTNNALPLIAPTDSPPRERNPPQEHLQTNRYQSKPPCALLTQDKHEHALTGQPREEPISPIEKVTPPQTHGTSLAQPSTYHEGQIRATRESDKHNLNARGPLKGTTRDENVTTRAIVRDMWQTALGDLRQTLLIAVIAVPPIVDTDSLAHVHNNSQRLRQTNRCQNKPMCSP